MNPGPIIHLQLQIIVCWLLLVGPLHAAPQPNTGNIRLIAMETSLGKLPLMADLKQMARSPDKLHVAYPVRREGQWTVWRDGVERGQYRGVRLLRFSPNGRRLAYVGARGGHWQEKRRPDPSVGQASAGMELREAKCVVVVHGKEGPAMETVGQVRFSPDSRHVAYAAMRGNQQLIVVDGQESQEYEAVWPLVFDGPKRIRFVATRYDESFNRELLRVDIEIVEEQP